MAGEQACATVGACCGWPGASRVQLVINQTPGEVGGTARGEAGSCECDWSRGGGGGEQEIGRTGEG